MMHVRRGKQFLFLKFYLRSYFHILNMILSQHCRSLPRFSLTALPPEIPIPAHPLCRNTGTQHRPTGNGSTPGLTSPQCKASVRHCFSQGGYSFHYLFFNLDGSPKPALALLLTLHRLVTLTFMHTAASLVPWNSQTHNHSSNCTKLPGPSDNQLFPWPHLQRPTFPSLSPRSVYLFCG